jgi:hypothetical protein
MMNRFFSQLYQTAFGLSPNFSGAPPSFPKAKAALEPERGGGGGGRLA